MSDHKKILDDRYEVRNYGLRHCKPGTSEALNKQYDATFLRVMRADIKKFVRETLRYLIYEREEKMKRKQLADVMGCSPSLIGYCLDPKYKGAIRQEFYETFVDWLIRKDLFCELPINKPDQREWQIIALMETLECKEVRECVLDEEQLKSWKEEKFTREILECQKCLLMKRGIDLEESSEWQEVIDYVHSLPIVKEREISLDNIRSKLLPWWKLRWIAYIVFSEV